MLNPKKNILLLFLIGVCATVFAQPFPSLDWSHGYTLDIVKKKNPNVRLDTTEKPNQYKVIEGREPAITETIFTFDSNNRLTNITWKKIGGTLDVYTSLVNEYSLMYLDVDKKESEFLPNWKENFASAECSVKNEKGNANILIVAPLDGRRSPYVILTETYKYQPKEIVIPKGRASIEDGAFFDQHLTSVIIPNSVTSIGERAFFYNYLTNITIPNSVISIEDGAFSRNYLISVNIPNSVKTIGKSAFSINFLDSITISNSVTEIEEFAFSDNCLTNVTIPNSVVTIGNGSFSRNQLTNINIPSSVAKIEEFAFSYNCLTNVTIPNSVVSIGEGAFKRNLLVTITIGANVKLGKDNNSGDSFDNKFDDFYRNNGRKAGTYIFANGKWSMK